MEKEIEQFIERGIKYVDMLRKNALNEENNMRMVGDLREALGIMICMNELRIICENLNEVASDNKEKK